jgi:leucyl-tRNA synthetase
MASLYAARPQKSLNWSDSAVTHCHRFLGSLWRYSQARLAMTADESLDDDGASTEFLRARLQKWCATAIEKITEDVEQLEMHSAARNLIRLFERIKGFESRVLAKRGALCKEDLGAVLDALQLMAAMLAPFAPHIAEELWIACSGTELTDHIPWPTTVKVAA